MEATRDLASGDKASFSVFETIIAFD